MSETGQVECGSCRGYGYFSKHGKPTIDRRDARKCLDCGGAGSLTPPPPKHRCEACGTDEVAVSVCEECVEQSVRDTRTDERARIIAAIRERAAPRYVESVRVIREDGSLLLDLADWLEKGGDRDG